MAGVAHGLGFGCGGFTDYGNGAVEYRRTGEVMPAFKVNVADITGFTVRRPTRDDKKDPQGLWSSAGLRGSGWRHGTRRGCRELWDSREDGGMAQAAPELRATEPSDCQPCRQSVHTWSG
jgi:hypothetical protein